MWINLCFERELLSNFSGQRRYQRDECHSKWWRMWTQHTGSKCSPCFINYTALCGIICYLARESYHFSQEQEDIGLSFTQGNRGCETGPQAVSNLLILFTLPYCQCSHTFTIFLQIQEETVIDGLQTAEEPKARTQVVLKYGISTLYQVQDTVVLAIKSRHIW